MSVSTGLLFGILVMIGWGAQKLFAKKLLDRIGAYSALVYGNGINALIIIVYCIVTGTFAIPKPQTAALVVLLSFLGALAIFSLYKAMEHGKLSIVVPVAHIYPVIIVAIAIFLFGESLSPMHAAAVSLAIIGTLLVSSHFSELKKLRIKSISKGVPYALATSVLWGISFALLKVIVDELGVFVTSLYFETLIVVILLVPAMLGFARLKKLKRKNALLAVSSGFLIAVGALSYNAGIAFGLLSIVGPLSAASLMVTVVASWLFLGEKIDINQKIAIAMIFAGILLLAL